VASGCVAHNEDRRAVGMPIEIEVGSPDKMMAAGLPGQGRVGQVRVHVWVGSWGIRLVDRRELAHRRVLGEEG